MTVEEHSVIGGLGSAVCDVVAEKAPAKVLKIGINDVFGESGPAVQLIQRTGDCKLLNGWFFHKNLHVDGLPNANMSLS